MNDKSEKIKCFSCEETFEVSAEEQDKREAPAKMCDRCYESYQDSIFNMED